MSIKGACGRILIVGGSREYTGAPYFCAVAALRAGADLVHVLCHEAAAVPIKCYSPELIVHGKITDTIDNTLFDSFANIDVVVVGSGLGRKQNWVVPLAVDYCAAKSLPLVLDGDALYALAKCAPQMLHEKKEGAPVTVLLPNIREFMRLQIVANNKKQGNGADLLSSWNAMDVAKWYNASGIIAKGAEDEIAAVENTSESVKRWELQKVKSRATPRRYGGQGDILAGVVATHMHLWRGKSSPLNLTATLCKAAEIVRSAGDKLFQSGEIANATLHANAIPHFDRT